jgi:hypothetical protein
MRKGSELNVCVAANLVTREYQTRVNMDAFRAIHRGSHFCYLGPLADSFNACLQMGTLDLRLKHPAMLVCMLVLIDSKVYRGPDLPP